MGNETYQNLSPHNDTWTKYYSKTFSCKSLYFNEKFQQLYATSQILTLSLWYLFARIQMCNVFVKFSLDLYSGWRIAFKNQDFPILVCHELCTYRGELSALTVRLMSKCSWSKLKWKRESKNAIPLPLQSCDSWMSCEKNNRDRKKDLIDKFR